VTGLDILIIGRSRRTVDTATHLFSLDSLVDMITAAGMHVEMRVVPAA
jgi:predicted XRE-type DNA-binding protein